MKKNIFYQKINLNNWGIAVIAVSEKGLYKTFLPKQNEQDINRFLENLSEQVNLIKNNDKCLEYINFIKDYFDGKKPEFSLSIDWDETTPFQKQAYLACKKIPYGQVRSYWWLAVRIGNPYAARAIGGAMASNPFPIIIPCHRVVRADNTLGGFGGGLDLKLVLLKHEGFNCDNIK